VYLHPTLARVDLSPVRPELLGRSPLAPAALARVAGRLVDAAELWRPVVRHDPGEPGYVRLLRTGGVEVWLLGWWPGQHVRAHDHGGASGAFAVVDGLLVEDCLDHTIWTTSRRTGFRAGARTAFGPGHVHVLGNPGPGVATSVHASSPPGLPLRFEGSAAGRAGRRDALGAAR
jgi:hypothetical protein